MTNIPTPAVNAPLPVGTVTGTIAAGDDARIVGAAPLVSPAFTGTPTAPHLPPGNVAAALATMLAAQSAAAPLYWYGYVGDGASHPISSVTQFAGTNTTGYTLAQWQALVPQIKALTDEIDGIALQTLITAQQTATGRAHIVLPPRSNARLSWTIVSTAFLGLEGNLSTLTCVGATPFTAIQHGTSTAPSSGEFHGHRLRFVLNGGVGLDAYFQPQVGAGESKCFDLRDSTMIHCGAPAVRLVNAPRDITLNGVSVWADAYTTGAAFLFAAEQYSSSATPSAIASTNGDSFSYTLIDCETVNFQWGYGWELRTPQSPQAYGGAGGYLEGVIVHSCRAYNGQGFAYVSNGFNSGTTSNYNAPLWAFRDCDYQGFGAFLDLSGMSDVLIDGNWLALDQSSPNASTAAVAMVKLAFCSKVVIKNNKFGVLSSATKATTIQCVSTDTLSSNVLIADNGIAEDTAIDCFVHWGSCNNSTYYYTNIERGTARCRPNKLTTFCRDDGGNQVSEGRVIALGGSLAADGKSTRYATSVSGTLDANSRFTVTLPTGLFRTIPTVLSACDGDTGANPGWVGAYPSTTTATQAVFQFGGGATASAAARVNFQLEGK